MLNKKNQNQPNTLIMGFGSEILTDDGIAIKLVNLLKNDLNHQEVQFLDANLISLETLELLVGFKKIVLIDATQDKNSDIGELRFLKLDQFKNSLHLINFHDLSIHQLIEMAQVLEIPITDDILIITINVEETEAFEKNISESLQVIYSDIYSKIFNKISRFMGEGCQ